MLSQQNSLHVVQNAEVMQPTKFELMQVFNTMMDINLIHDVE